MGLMLSQDPSVCVQVSLNLMVPKCQRSNAGNLEMPKKSHMSLKEKVNQLNKQNKNSYAEVANIYSRNESSISEIRKKKKHIC